MGSHQPSDVMSGVLASGSNRPPKSESQTAGKIDMLDVGEWDRSGKGRAGTEVNGPPLWSQLRARKK